MWVNSMWDMLHEKFCFINTMWDIPTRDKLCEIFYLKNAMWDILCEYYMWDCMRYFQSEMFYMRCSNVRYSMWVFYM